MKKIDSAKNESSSQGSFFAALCRFVTFLVALVLMAVIVLYPRAIANDMTTVPHGALVGLLIGMSIAWVWGLGFVPRHPILKFVFSPWLAWGLMLFFSGLIFFK